MNYCTPYIIKQCSMVHCELKDDRLRRAELENLWPVLHLLANVELTPRKQKQYDSKIYWLRVNKVLLLGKQPIPGMQ